MDNKTSSNLKNEQNNEENPQMLNHNGDNQASNHLDKIKPDYKDSSDDTTTEEIELIKMEIHLYIIPLIRIVLQYFSRIEQELYKIKKARHLFTVQQ